MDVTQARSASELLIRHWKAGTMLPVLPEPLRPANRAEGYAIQAQLERLSAKPLWGWKIAATSAVGQQHIGIDGPLAGWLLAETVHADGATLPFGSARGADRMCWRPAHRPRLAGERAVAAWHDPRRRAGGNNRHLPRADGSWPR